MTNNALYIEPQLVDIYDVLNPWGEDSEFYFSLGGSESLRILDAGCGTGLLAAIYAKAGHAVTGIDPAPQMLEIARRRDGGSLVDWHISTLQSFESTKCFDLIVMTGHAFQCLLTDEEIYDAFAAAAKCLAVGGKFVFETRNPDCTSVARLDA